MIRIIREPQISRPQKTTPPPQSTPKVLPTVPMPKKPEPHTSFLGRLFGIPAHHQNIQSSRIQPPTPLPKKPPVVTPLPKPAPVSIPQNNFPQPKKVVPVIVKKNTPPSSRTWLQQFLGIYPVPKKIIPVITTSQPAPKPVPQKTITSVGTIEKQETPSTPNKVRPAPSQSTWSKMIQWLGMIGVGQEKEYIIENLSVLLSAGNDIITTLASIRTEIKSRTLRSILSRIETDVSAGISLSKALEDSEIFPKHISALIAIGEQSGKMEENLQVVVSQQAKDRMFFSKIRSAMIYPGLVLGLMVSVGIGVAWFILPRIATVFSQLKIDLPFITRVIINMGQVLERYGAIMVPLIIVSIAVIIFMLFFYQKTKFLGQALLFKIPGIKELIRELELAHIGFILGTLLNAGVPIVTALDALNDAVGFYKYRKLYTHLKNRIEAGDQFKDGFASFPGLSELIPAPVQQIITAGEQSGNLEQSFKKIADIYEQKTEITTKNISVLLEPILLVIVWIAVVLVALGVILPIYGLIGGLDV